MTISIELNNPFRVKDRVEKPYYEIKGGTQLKGEVTLPGAKNAALPAIVAACLSEEDVVLSNVPLGLNDVKLLTDLLCSMGASIVQIDKTSIVCNGSKWRGGRLDCDKASKIRHSLLLLGASVRWEKELVLPLPGGCSIGERKHDLHVSGLREIGHLVGETEEQIEITPMPINEQEALVEFYYPTFGGTLNILFASVRGDNRIVTIRNAARNPEVHDVINLLKKMGSNIKWIDNTTIEIKSAPVLNGCKYQVMSDRIIASTIIAATGVTKGHVLIKGGTSEFLKTEIGIWQKAGLWIDDIAEGLEIKWKQPLLAIDITTGAYPDFHTDIQPLHTVLMATAIGTSSVKETILDGRFNYCYELNKLGADIKVNDGGFQCVNGAQGQIATITGLNALRGAHVSATDIRGGAAVVLAALISEGVTTIDNVYQVERGYNKLPELLSALGASFIRVSE